MEGKKESLRERWKQRSESAFQRMFEGKSQEELVTLSEREDMAVLIGKELAAFLLEEHVARDAAAEPGEAATTCCPKCGQPGKPAARKDEKMVKRRLTTRAGEIRLKRQRWYCAKCRVIFFSAGRATPSGNGRLQPEAGRAGGSSVEQGVVLC